MRRIFVVMATVFLCSAFCLPPAGAELVPIAITAEVTRLQDDRGLLEGKINIGDLITGVYIYDSSTPDSDPVGYEGLYEHHTPPYGMTLTVGGFVFMTDPENVDFVIKIADDVPMITPSDWYVVASYNNLPLSNGVMPGKIVLSAGGDAGVFWSDALPMTAPVLSERFPMVALFWGAEGSRDFYIRGDVTSAVLIPEPATFALLGIGTLVLLRSRERPV